MTASKLTEEGLPKLLEEDLNKFVEVMQLIEPTGELTESQKDLETRTTNDIIAFNEEFGNMSPAGLPIAESILTEEGNGALTKLIAYSAVLYRLLEDRAKKQNVELPYLTHEVYKKFVKDHPVYFQVALFTEEAKIETLEDIQAAGTKPIEKAIEYRKKHSKEVHQKEIERTMSIRNSNPYVADIIEAAEASYKRSLRQLVQFNLNRALGMVEYSPIDSPELTRTALNSLYLCLRLQAQKDQKPAS